MREIARIYAAMMTADHLLTVVDAYREARGVSDARVSTLLFNDGKRITAVRAGGDIGSRHLASSFRWLSDHWPDPAPWPSNVPRPPKSSAPIDESSSEGAAV